MKIEKLNENQIRCTLSRKDLEERHIKLSELAYGSEKAKSLFRDMIRKAGEQFGFKADDLPLMVEAIPANADTLVLVISKVEYPDELDTRFSRFSEPDEEYFEDNDDEETFEDTLSRAGASDILDLFRKMKDEPEKKTGDKDKELKSSDVISPEKNSEPAASGEPAEAEREEKQNPAAADGAGQNKSGKPSAGNSADPEQSAEKQTMKDPKADLVRVIRFDSMEQAERLAHVLSDFYKGRNDLYKVSGNEYYLFLHKNTHTPEEFNKICNIASEYARPTVYREISAAWFEEHAKVIRRKDALQMLAKL